MGKHQLEEEIERALTSCDWDALPPLLKKYTKIVKNPLLEALVQAECAAAKSSGVDWSDVRAHVDAALAVEKNNEHAKSLMVRVEFESGNKAEAYTLVCDWLSQHKRDDKLPLRQKRQHMRMLVLKGRCEEARSEPTAASLVYNEVVSVSRGYFDVQHHPVNHTCRPLLETALSRFPALLLSNNGNVAGAVEAYRRALRLRDASPSFRCHCLWELGQLLIYRCNALDYPALQTPSSATSSSSSSSSTPAHQHQGGMIYTPSTMMEETLLVLLLYEKESRAGVQKDDATPVDVADGMCLSFTRCQRYGVLIEALEHGVAVRCEDAHTWFQFGLALLSASRHERALFVLRETLALQPDDVDVGLVTAVAMIHHGRTDEAVQVAESLVESSLASASPHSSRCIHVLGVAYGRKASEMASSHEASKWWVLALKHLHSANTLESGTDSAVLFHLALAYANIREVSKAVHFARQSLELSQSHASTWVLLALLLSAKKQCVDAVDLCRAGLREVPDDFSLFITLARLLESQGHWKAAMSAYRDAFEQYKHSPVSRYVRREGVASVVAPSNLSSIGRGAGKSGGADGGGGSGVGGGAGGNDSARGTGGTGAAQQTLGPSHPLVWMWTLAGSAFSQLGLLENARECVAELVTLLPGSSAALHMLGVVAELNNDNKNAIEAYERALKLDSSNLASKVRLGTLYREYCGDVVRAETLLTAVVQQDSTYHTAWHELGMVFKTQGLMERASECFVTASELQETAAIIPYKHIAWVL